MAVAFRARTMKVGAAGKTSNAFTVPGTVAAGDTLYIWVYADVKTTLGLPTGGQTWTEVAQTQSSQNVTYACFELPNWNGTDTTYTVSWTGSAYTAGAIEAFSGTDTTNPRNVSSGTEFKENAASKNAVVDGYTTTVENCMRASGVFNNEGLSATPAAEWTEDGDQGDSPQIAHKTALVSKGAQGSVTHALGSAIISMTLGFALQPPQAGKAEIKPSTVTAVGSASLALTAKTGLALSSVGAVGSATLALSTKGGLALSPAAAVSNANLALKAKTGLTLGAVAAKATATLALTTGARAHPQQPAPFGKAPPSKFGTSKFLPEAPQEGDGVDLALSAVAGQGSATLSLRAKTTMTMAAGGVSTATLALRARTQIVPSPVAGSGGATLTLSMTSLALAAHGVSSATLILTQRLQLSKVVGKGSATLMVTHPLKPGRYVNVKGAWYAL